jgi:hypothetical protein
VRAKKIAALLAATAIVGALALPAGAFAARPHRYKQKASVTAQVELRGTHGFHLGLNTLDPYSAALQATRGISRVGMVNVSYFSLRGRRRPTFHAGELNVEIGPFGHFRGRFVPTGTETQNLDPECKGNPTTIEKGFFVGSFDFHGERGYTVVHSHRARGTVTRQPAGTCTFDEDSFWHESAREIKEQRERERNEFHLLAADEGARVLFQARREEPPQGIAGPSTTFNASVNGKRVGDFRVSYGAFLFGLEEEDPTNFQVPNLAEPLAEATVTPPAPFSGSATFHLDNPTTATWTGDLAVELPGLGKVPLTGDSIDAGLCKGRSNCTKTLPKNLQPVLEAPSNVIVAVSVSKPKRDS